MEAKVLSIQSHVVSGYVGNKCVTFPLQLLGIEVETINTVQLSNHTGYPVFLGTSLKEIEISDLVRGLSLNNLDRYTHVSTGYNRSKSCLLVIANTIKHFKSKNPDLIYVCDPVLGDKGKLYVSDELIPVYRDTLVSMADIITPNQFELGWLSGQEINNIEDVVLAMNSLHDKGCKTIVVSSVRFDDDKDLTVVVSEMKGEEKKRATVTFPCVNKYFTGTGDLLNALFIAWLIKDKNNTISALEKAVASIQSVIKNTVNYYEDRQSVGEFQELRIIQSKNDLENPKVVYRAEYMQK